MKARQLTLSALALMLPSGELAAGRPGEPRIYIVRPSGNYATANDGMWVPSASEVGRARSALLAYLAVPHPPSTDRRLAEEWNERYRPTIQRGLDAYTLQFAGVRKGPSDSFYETRGAGPKLVLINGLCRLFPGSERLRDRQIIEISDGGACYFIAVYDPVRDAILEFQVNGQA